jgi:hypothetical protein
MPDILNTTELLAGFGLEIEDTSSDDVKAADLLHRYAEDPAKAARSANKDLAVHTPASVLQVKALLREFAHPVVETATEIRNLVVNKLLIESDNPDPRIRLKAVELLGKISDVSLFTEKSEVTVTHQTTADLKEKLRERLAKMANPRVFENDEPLRDVTHEGETLEHDA